MGERPRLVWRYGSTAFRLPSAISCLAVSADGARVAAGEQRGETWILDAASGARAALLGSHGAPVSAAALSADGRVAATAGLDGTVRVWDVDAGRERWRRGEATDPDAGTPNQRLASWALAVFSAVRDLAISPDGRLLAVAGGAEGLVLDLESRAIVRGIGPAQRVTFDPTGELLAALDGASLRLHRRSTWFRPWGRDATLDLPGGNGVAFAPDGALVAAVGPGTLLVADRAGRQRLRVALEGAPVHVGFAPGGGLTVVSREAASVRALDDGRRLRDRPAPRLGYGAAAQGAGLLALGHFEGVFLHDAATLEPRGGASGFPSTIWQVRFSGDGGRLLVGSSLADGGHLLDATDGRLVAAPAFARDALTGDADLSGDGALVAISAGARVSVHETADGRQLDGFDAPGGVRRLVLVSDASRLAVGLERSGKGWTPLLDHSVWDRRGRRLATARWPAVHAAFTQDGQAVRLAPSRELLDLRSGEAVGGAAPGPFRDALLSRDGAVMAVVAEDGGSVDVVEVATGELLRRLPLDLGGGPVEASLSDGGGALTVRPASKGGLLWWFDLRAGTRRELDLGETAIGAHRPTPDGRRLVATCHGSVAMWDPAR